MVEVQIQLDISNEIEIMIGIFEIPLDSPLNGNAIIHTTRR